MEEQFIATVRTSRAPANENSGLDQPVISAFLAGTDIELASNVFKMQFASLLGIPYNTFMNHLNCIRPIWSPTLGEYITLLVEGSSYEDVSLTKPYLNTEPVTGIDLSSLPDGIIAVLPDKVTRFGTYQSSAQAALILDGKVECLYISRYVNVDKLVATSAGSFYFVRNPNYIVPTLQFQGGVKGVKSAIILFDPILGLYVSFPSKAELSSFIWGAKNRTQAFDRYLVRVEGVKLLAFKGQLLFYKPQDLPVGVKPISISEYCTLIGGNRYVHPRDVK